MWFKLNHIVYRLITNRFRLVYECINTMDLNKFLSLYEHLLLNDHKRTLHECQTKIEKLRDSSLKTVTIPSTGLQENHYCGCMWVKPENIQDAPYTCDCDNKHLAEIKAQNIIKMYLRIFEK